MDDRQAILDAFPCNVAIIDGSGAIVAVNETWTRFSRDNGDPGLAQTGVGQNYLSVCDRSQTEESAAAKLGLEAVIAGRAPTFALEYPCSSPTAPRWFAMSAAPSGPAGGAIVIHHDVTQRHLAEERVPRSQQLETLGGLAAGIAHEINTPLQYIGDNLGFLQGAVADLTPLLERIGQVADSPDQRPDGFVDELIREYSDRDIAFLVAQMPGAFTAAVEGTERVSSIVRAMKTFSYRGPAEKGAVDLNEVVAKALMVCRHEWHSVAESVVDFDPDLPPVVGLAGPIGQVVLNLVINAAHAIAETRAAGADLPLGQITVTTKVDGPWAEVTIADTGAGIPEAARPHVFEPFFTTKAAGRGTGQGLALAHKVVVEDHGGEIKFKTEIGRGTAFVVRLPVAGSAAP